MKRILVLTAFTAGIALAGAAEAQIAREPNPAPDQQPAQAGAAAGPCVRGQTTLRMAGVDIDAMKCEKFLAAGRFAELQSDIISLAAELELTKSDLRSSRNATQDAQKLATYWQSWAKESDAKADYWHSYATGAAWAPALPLQPDPAVSLTPPSKVPNHGPTLTTPSDGR